MKDIYRFFHKSNCDIQTCEGGVNCKPKESKMKDIKIKKDMLEMRTKVATRWLQRSWDSGYTSALLVLGGKYQKESLKQEHIEVFAKLLAEELVDEN